jgi:tRNA A37 N6-isopentenylltransferase MiaA
MSEKTWQYAKRQKTWFKRDRDITWLPPNISIFQSHVSNFLNKNRPEV